MEEQAQTQSSLNQEIPQTSISTKQISKLFIITSFLVFLLMAGGLIYLGYQNYLLQQELNQALEQKTDKSITSVIPSTKSSPTTIIGGQCTNETLGISITIPHDWTCESEEGGWINIESELFTISISNMGRGIYCGGSQPPPNTDDSCRTSTFFENDKIDLTLFTSYGEDKEIFGGIIPLNKVEQNSKTWISITYTNMEKQKLTDSQKAQLIDVLNSITVIK